MHQGAHRACEGTTARTMCHSLPCSPTLQAYLTLSQKKPSAGDQTIILAADHFLTSPAHRASSASRWASGTSSSSTHGCVVQVAVGQGFAGGLRGRTAPLSGAEARDLSRGLHPWFGLAGCVSIPRESSLPSANG